MGRCPIRIMAVTMILRVLLFGVVSITQCELTSSFKNGGGQRPTSFGEFLKPPPVPLSKIVPVPFHVGPSRSQRQNSNEGYNYQPPPPPPPPPAPPTPGFQFPAPFYKQYNFNFLPPPQPFTTTPSPSLYQKVSGWLFSAPQTSYGPPVYSSNVAPLKKDCNPCNLVPWIPVIRYDLAKKLQPNIVPTYGPPSPTAYAPNFQNVGNYNPQSFQGQKLPQLSPGVPHAIYGPPAQNINNFVPSSTYGPPSPTHTLPIPSQSPISSTYTANISPSYGVPSSTYGVPSSSYGVPSSSYGVPSSSFTVSSSSYGTQTSTIATPSSVYEAPRQETLGFGPVTSGYPPFKLNSELPQNNGVDFIKDITPASNLQLPKVTHPSAFKNSYGEPITNTYALDIPYSVSATAAESTKIKTEVLPTDSKPLSTSNASLALANPAPFTLNRGRNIHTLQPVALPNLSISPLPPIFNARPFRPILPTINADFLQGLNAMQQSSNKNNFNIEQSIPVAEYTQSIDYPPAVIRSPVIDIDAIRASNQSKTYRNIPNGHTVDEIRDISSQASEDHVSATKSDQDSSFESTGLEFGNDLYDSGFPSDLKPNSKVPSNHKSSFADLRGVKDEDVDKYRTESNLQNIDSPLLYLKPSAPHKDYENFVFAVSTPGNDNSYEIYDESPTTAVPHQSSQIPSSWDESRTDYGEALVPPPAPQQEENKPKIVQIIVPYTTSQQSEKNNVNFDTFSQTWTDSPVEDYQGRKVPTNTENSFVNTVTEGYSTVSTTTEEATPTVTENYDSDVLNAQAILNDLYDVKEPPFDIIKLQHTIDDWTQQEFSKHYSVPQKTRVNTKYAKQIPDEYFTTISPITNYVTLANNYNYDFYDHEGSSSNHHFVTDEKNKTVTKPRKEYNTIERTKNKHSSSKNEEKDEVKKPHIYTAASSFRSTTTTPAPWGKIQTSISPLTKEKVYVVTSKPWRDASIENDKTKEWYVVESFESKKTKADNDVSASDNLPFKSPRFPNRPTFGFSGSGEGKIELKSDSSYAFSRSWHQSINDLESQAKNNTSILGGSLPYTTTTNNNSEATTETNLEEDSVTTTITTAGPHEGGKL